ncbi:MAG: PLP-dependent transferase [Nitrososphaerota archaeon]|nr:PLP-dependent transferase [Nitrososphaerota archaeon]MDG6922203.1 PLP-dependent transferase [Nitrososphaerota archaeon]
MTEQTTKKKTRAESGFATRAIHAGQSPDPTTGAISTPIYQTTTYAQKAVGVHKGFTYSRTGNPTVQVLEDSLAILEKGVGGACFGTGMSAITAVFSLLSKGDHAVVARVVYGGTPRLCDNILARFGLRFTYVDTSDIETLKEAITEKTKLVFIETPANPTVKLTDIKAVSEVKKNAKLVVDNTFLSPALQVPIDLGADITVHSTTKYIEGHNTTVGGAVILKNKKDHEDIKYLQNAMGLIQSPFNAWLTIRGLKTLDIRMKKHSENAQIIAEYLEGHPKITKVLYPGLDSFPQASLARKQHIRGHGGMLCFELKGGVKSGLKFASNLSLIVLAENLGAIETMVTHPATMTHAAMGKKARLEAGITDGLVRLSVGLEDPDDLIADLDQAIKKATS